MKPITLLFLFLFQLPILLSGQFFVLKVAGEVYADDQLVKPKDKLAESAQLRFKSQEAYVYVISPSRGQFYLSGKKGKKNAKGEFFVALKKAIIPSDEFLAASTRGDAEALVFKDQYDFKAYFRGELCFQDSLKFTTEGDQYSLEGYSTFHISHQIGRKNLAFSLSGTRIDNSIFYNEKGKDISAKIKASYLEYREKGKSPERFGPFQIRVLSQEESIQLKAELKDLYEILSSPDRATFIQQQAVPYVSSNYCKITFAELETLLSDLK